MHNVYILWCADNKPYIGCTHDLNTTFFVFMKTIRIIMSYMKYSTTIFNGGEKYAMF